LTLCQIGVKLTVIKNGGSKMAKQRLNIQLEEAMKDYCMQKADELGISMNGFINVALAQYKQQDEGMKAMTGIDQLVKKIDEISKKI
jgi:hypothetical protein